MDKLELQKVANEVRKDIVTAVHAAKAGHPGGSLSAADLFTYLYFEEMNVDPKNPKDPDRDRFVLSKGHTAPGLYAALAEKGYFPKEDLLTLRHLGSYLQGHPDVQKTPGIEAGTGSLGQGLSIGLGMALGLKLDRLDSRTYVLVGDGEIAEGQIWEAAMAASAFKADNLVAIVDRNRLQANGKTKERFDTGDIMAKFLSFGWHVIEINGHDMREILNALDEAETVKGVPTAIIANTVKGKGVSFAENVVGYHNGMLTEETYRQALLELSAQEQEA